MKALLTLALLLSPLASGASELDRVLKIMHEDMSLPTARPDDNLAESGYPDVAVQAVIIRHYKARYGVELSRRVFIEDFYYGHGGCNAYHITARCIANVVAHAKASKKRVAQKKPKCEQTYIPAGTYDPMGGLGIARYYPAHYECL